MMIGGDTCASSLNLLSWPSYRLAEAYANLSEIRAPQTGDDNLGWAVAPART
jgi:hypothetical protein